MLVHALSKCERFHQIYRAIQRFREGFLADNEDAKDPYRKTYMVHWSDDILIKSLQAQQSFFPPDYPILVGIIKTKTDSNFRRV